MPKTRVGDLEVVWDVAGPAAGEPVLMINGIGAVRGSWSLQVEALSTRYRVYTYDNRDVGETGAADDPHPYGMDQFARDAADLMELLEIGTVHVIGASMGGAIAQELALSRPDLVRSVQIVCSWPRTDPWLSELFRQWQDQFAAMGPLAWARGTWVWVFTHRWFQNPAHLENLIRDTSAAPHPQTPEMFNRQAEAAIAYDSLGRLANISVPVHVIAGAEDIFTPPRFSEEIAAAIPGARLTILPMVGHGMFWETPEVFNAALNGFLDARSG